MAYDPPRVEDVPAEEGSAITAAGVTADERGGPEWRPADSERYEPPVVEDVPARDGPAVTASAVTGMF